MRLGLMIEGQEGLDWGRWKRLLHAAEDLGFSSVYRSDHFFSLVGRTHKASLETWTSLGYAAQETKRVRLGTLACPMTFRHPSLLARIAAQTDALSGGRLDVGIGAGWNAVEHAAYGIPFPPLKTRMDMLEEGAQVLKLLWTGGPVNFQGAIYSLKDATCCPLPAQSPMPLLVGGTGVKRTLRIVARYADHWNAVSISLADYGQRVAALEGYCKEIGRKPSAIKRSLMAGFVLGRHAAEIEQRYENVARYISPEQRGAAGPSRDALLARGWFIGTPEQAVAQMRRWQEAGVQEIMLQHHDHEDIRVLELIAKEIMPKVA